MEMDSSSWHVQKQWSCKVDRLMLKFVGQADYRLPAPEQRDIRPGTLDNVWHDALLGTVFAAPEITENG